MRVASTDIYDIKNWDLAVVIPFNLQKVLLITRVDYAAAPVPAPVCPVLVYISVQLLLDAKLRGGLTTVNMQSSQYCQPAVRRRCQERIICVYRCCTDSTPSATLGSLPSLRITTCTSGLELHGSTASQPELYASLEHSAGLTATTATSIGTAAP